MSDAWYVYILRCADNSLYTGVATDVKRRLEEHNNGKSRYTANRGPWKMVYLEKMPDKRTALIRERQLKRCNSNYIKWLIKQEPNIVDRSTHR